MKWRRWPLARRIGPYQLTWRQDWLALWRLVCSRSFAGVLTAGALSIVLLLAGEYFTDQWGLSRLDTPGTPMVYGVIYMLVVVAPVMIAAVVFARGIQRRSNAILRRMGFPVCIECQYDLQGLEDNPLADRCPECGALIADMPPVGR